MGVEVPGKVPWPRGRVQGEEREKQEGGEGREAGRKLSPEEVGRGREVTGRATR